MPVPLRRALQESMSGWEEAIPSTWQSVFHDIRLAFSDVPSNLKLESWIPIFPTFKKPTILGAPRRAHTFRALQGITPARTRVVIVGQDPYPDIAKATGMAFEQGDIEDWIQDAHRVATSLRSILQNVAAAATGNKSYRDPKRGWRRLVAAIRSREIRIQPPEEWFKELQAQGVLWINTTLTISLFQSVPDHQKGHAACWRPFTQGLFRHLASRPNGGIVFVLWGNWARSFRAKILEAAQEAGSAENVKLVEATHPATRRFLQGPNALATINQALGDLGLAAIRWTT